MVCDERSAAIALALCPALEPSTLRRLVCGLGGALAVWEGTREQWQAVCRMRPETVQRLDAWRRSCIDSSLEGKLAARGIRCLLPSDAAFPPRLLELPDPPVVLFAVGEAEAVTERPAAAVVGTRRASVYGLEAAAWVSETLARAGCSVVSGLAVGIDAAAHEACLNAGGLSAAVLGCGVDRCYPPSHRRLYERIRAQGVLLSEYAPGTPVAKHRFPERNRLIAALGQVTIVVQAGERSGALRTVDAALEIGRDVWVVPVFKGNKVLP